MHDDAQSEVLITSTPTAVGHAGWSYRKNGLETRQQGPVTIYGVPYSEHSSFPELRECVKLLRPKRLVPTVNAGNPTASRRVADRFAGWMHLLTYFSLSYYTCF